jgi:hypothetical protein
MDMAVNNHDESIVMPFAEKITGWKPGREKDSLNSSLKTGSRRRNTMKKNFMLMMAAILMLCVASVSAQEGKACDVPEGLMKMAQEEKAFRPLFKDDLSNALKARNGWAFEDGVLTAKGKGDIWTKEKYGNFILDLEFKCDPETNSGVFIRTSSIRDWLNTAIEVQVLQPNDHYDNPRHHCGGIFDCLAPSKQMVREPGAWNHYIIIAKDNMIHVVLNDVPVACMDLDKWTEAGKNPDGSPNKFKYPYAELERNGHIGLQYHGNPIWYRNLKIRPLED